MRELLDEKILEIANDLLKKQCREKVWFHEGVVQKGLAPETGVIDDEIGMGELRQKIIGEVWNERLQEKCEGDEVKCGCYEDIDVRLEHG